jgi:hypothetical protein
VITFAALFLLLGLGLIALRPSFAGPLDTLEWFFVGLSPVPVILSFVVPLFVARPLSDRATQIGVILSLVLLVGGVGLLVRRSLIDAGRDARLIAALLLAAMPALMVGLVALLFAL